MSVRGDVPESSESSEFLSQFDAAARVARARSSRKVWKLAVPVLLAIGLVAGATWYLFVRDESSPSAAVLLQEGLAAHVAGDLEGALDAYGEVLEQDPTNLYASYNIGLINHGRGDLGVAESSYRAALAVDRTYVPALFNLAVLMYEAGDYAEATELYERIITLDPSHASAHLNLGFTLRAAGDTAAGDAEIAEAIELDPSLGGAPAEDAEPAAG